MSNYIRITYRREGGALSSLSLSPGEHRRLAQLAAGNPRLVCRLFRRVAKQRAGTSRSKRSQLSSKIARRPDVSRVWVYQVRARWERDGCRSSLRQGGYRVSRIAHREATIRGWIAAEPDVTLAELCERLAQQGILIKVPALWHQLDRWRLPKPTQLSW